MSNVWGDAQRRTLLDRFRRYGPICLRYSPKVLFVTVVVVLMLLAYDLECGRAGPFDFAIRRVCLEAIVRKVRTINIARGAFARFQVGPLMNAGSLRRVVDWKHANDPSTGAVLVLRDSTGADEVAIITQDLGHFGTFGYIYSMHPLRSAGKPASEAGFSWLPSLGQQVAPHWWAAYNNLN